MLGSTWLRLVAAALLLLASSCNESTLSGKATSGGPSRDDQDDDQDDDHDDDGGPGGSATGTTGNTGTGTGTGTGGLGTGIDGAGTATSTLPGIATGTGNDCVSAGSGRMHTVLIFDNSGSQSGDDLASMRTGATGLANRVATEAAKAGAPVMSMSVVRFSSDAVIGANGWVKSTDAAFLSKITADINAATADDGGGTEYHTAFAKAQELYAQIDSTAATKTDRNFVVFLTDGDPDDDLDALPTAQSLVQDKGVAVIAIATGASGGDAVATLKQFALPAAGVVAPDHVGRQLLAETQAEIEQIFGNVASSILVDPCK
jgi:uncharacterized protein YegL